MDSASTPRGTSTLHTARTIARSIESTAHSGIKTLRLSRHSSQCQHAV